MIYNILEERKKEDARISKISNDIVVWLNKYLNSSGCEGFVVGISGGIDSAVVASLCARTHQTVNLLSLPYGEECSRVSKLDNYLFQRSPNVEGVTKIQIDQIYNIFSLTWRVAFGKDFSGLTKANLLARIRMILLYAYANQNNSLVVGTGNKIEDLGVGFFTKYGDGGVDLSPAGSLYKSEMYKIGIQEGLPQSIITASPTDDLWDDGRTDEDQLEATYPELEKAMRTVENSELPKTNREREVVDIFLSRKRRNLHKMLMPPVFEVKR